MSLKIWLPLTGTRDNKGTSNIPVANVGATIDVYGKIGRCYSFNGTSNYLQFNKSLFSNASEEFSYACWFKPSSTASGCLFSCRTAVNSTGITIFVNNSNNILFDIGNERQTKTYALSSGTWYHLAFTYKKGRKKTIYINGAQIDSVNSTSSATTVSTTNMFIGASQNANGTVNANYLNGMLNDVCIYDHCLSKAEVHELSQGLVLHYKLDTANPNPNLLPDSNAPSLNKIYGSYNRYWESVSNGTYTCTFEEITDPPVAGIKYGVREKVTVVSGTHQMTWYSGGMISVTIGTTYTMSCYVKNTCGTSGMIFRFQIGDGQYSSQTVTVSSDAMWHQYSWTFTPNSTDSTNNATRIYCGGLGSVGEVLICGYKLEQGSVATPWIPHSSEPLHKTLINNSVLDSSGHGYHGTIAGSLIIEQSSPKYNSGTHIASTSHYIKCGSFPTSGFSNSYSFSWWSKCGSWGGLMNWGFSDGIRLNAIYNGTLWNTGDGSNNPLYNPGTTTQVTAPSVNEWHHFVMTGDGTTCKVYKDGIHWATAKTYKSISGTQIYINGWNDATTYSYANLYMSDFRVYATALSADDVLALYQTEAKVDKGGSIHAREFNTPSSDNIFVPSTVTTGTATVTVSGQTIKIKNDTAKTYASSQTPLATTLGLVNGHFYKVTCHANFVSGSGLIGFRRTSDNGIIASSGWFSASKDLSFIYRYDSSVPTYLSMFSTGSTSTTGEVDYQNVCVQDVSASITNEGIFKANNFIEQGALLNNATSGSYKPAANVTNSTGCYCQVDFSAFRNSSVPVTFQVEYDVSWSNFAYTSGGTVKTYMQGSNRKIATGGYVWEGSNYIANSTSFVTDIQANSTGSKHISRTTTIPVSWFQTYDASQFGFRTDYSNGNGTIGYSNFKVTLLSTNTKFNKEFISTNNLIEM